MSALLLAGLVVVGLMACLNLVLTYGVIRRLREHAERLSDDGGVGTPHHTPSVGGPVPEFSAVTLDGTEVSGDGFTDGVAYAGFFTTSCPPCRERLPEFAAFAAGVGKERVLVVVQGDPKQAEALTAEARRVAQVVVEPDGGPVGAAFEVTAFPTMLALSGGTVEYAANTMGQLASPARA